MAVWRRHTSFLLPKGWVPAWCVCGQRGSAGVGVLSPVGATEFFYGFSLSLFGHNSAAHRWDTRFKGAVLMHLNHTLLKHGFVLGIEHREILSGWLPWSCGRDMRLEHVTRSCNTLWDQERLLTKSRCDFCLTETLRQGSPAWVCRATAVTERKLCWTRAVAAEAPDLGAQIHHLFSQYCQPLFLWESLALPPSLTWWWLVQT